MTLFFLLSRRVALRVPATPWLRFKSGSGKQSILTPPSIAKLVTPSENAQAREWISQFKTQSIPKSLVEITFSRSSGPGGQNVNKVNTKATLRCPVSSSWIPPWARDTLKACPSYVSSSQSILITSTVHRSQAGNIEECLSKLHSIVVNAASATLVNQPSVDQKRRVEELQKHEAQRRRRDKDRRSSLKRSRNKRDWE